MKLQDIFRNSDFEKVFDYICKIDPKSKGSKFSYMTAFEYLCDMKAQSGYLIEFKESTYNKKVYNADLVTIGEHTVIPDGVKVGKNTAIWGDTEASDYPDGMLQSGDAIVKVGGLK